MSDSFADRLAHNVQARQSHIVVGLDPNPDQLWPQAVRGLPQDVTVQERVAAAVKVHCLSVIAAVAEYCVAIKPQVACFERLGAHGWDVLSQVTQYAQQQGLLVIADVKRGDIDVSARAYAQAMFGDTQTPFGKLPSLTVDAITVNPYLGRDSLAPIIDVAQDFGCGVFVLVRTSNPGGADLQDLELADGGCVWERVAKMVHTLKPQQAQALSSVGAVFGATVPEHLVQARTLMPNAIFLLPGVGAQGGRIEDLAPVFNLHAAGGLIAVSRSIVNAWQQEGRGADPVQAARASAQHLRDQAWQLIV